MQKLIIRLSEVVGIVCLIAFIIFVTNDEKLSSTEPEYMAEQVISAVNTEELEERDGLFLKKRFGIDADNIEYFSYYSSDSVMDVREFLIIRLDPSLYEATSAAIESLLSSNQILFEGYAPEQSALLENAVLVCEKGYLLYAVGEDAQTALTVFRDNL